MENERNSRSVVEEKSRTEKNEREKKESKFWHYVGFGCVLYIGSIISDALGLTVFITYSLIIFLAFNFHWFGTKNKEKDIRGYKWLAGRIRSRFLIWLIYVVSAYVLMLSLSYIFILFIDLAEVYVPRVVNNIFGLPVLLFVFVAVVCGFIYLAEKIFGGKKTS
jgi:hypothetical protein